MNDNRFYVVTGVSGAGKTTTLRGLSKRGFQIFPEMASIVGEEERRINPDWNYKNSYPRFIESIVRKHRDIEQQNYEAPVFFDRGVIDCLVYCHYDHQYISQDLLQACEETKYLKTFLLKPTEPEAKIVGGKTLQQVLTIESLIEELYSRYGSNVHTVPAMPVNDRIEFILNVIKETTYGHA